MFFLSFSKTKLFYFLGVGWGNVINGGFGLVLDGSEEAEKRAEMMLKWDVNNGVSRRAWAGNENALLNIKR